MRWWTSHSARDTWQPGPRRVLSLAMTARTPFGRHDPGGASDLEDGIVEAEDDAGEAVLPHGFVFDTFAAVAVATAVDLLALPGLTTMIGIDETRTRRAGWVLADATWRRSDPWITSIVHLD